MSCDDFTPPTDVPGKKPRNYFSFATKYCSWHNPDSFPIWDSNVERYLGCLQKKTELVNDLNIGGQWKYSEFYMAMHRIRDHYRLSSLNFKDIDKFLWLYGGKSRAIGVGQRRF